MASIVYPTVICTTSSVSAGSNITITVNSTLSASTPSGTQIRNIAYVCKAGDTPTTTCNPACIDPNNPTCTPSPPPLDCSTVPSSPNYDPACVITPGTASPYISIKKYANSSDGQLI